MKEQDDLKSDILSIINDRQQITYDQLSGIAFSRGIPEKALKDNLRELEISNMVASRSVGGILTYYILDNEIRKILVVEDDKNINKLMTLSIGKGFDIKQAYDGKDAIVMMRKEKPDLVVLDLMLPGTDGLDVCQTVKTDPALKDTIVIIVSAMDPTFNRFKGIKYGADYYIKKPFDPDELRSLVRIFLKKKGKKFDPLIDLPNEEKISEAVEKAVNQDSNYEIGRLRVDGIGSYAKRFGERSAVTILRLISQLLQDQVKLAAPNTFVGFLDSEDFVIAGERSSVNKVISEVSDEFGAVKNFIYQSGGYKPMELGIDDTYESADKPHMHLSYKKITKESLLEKREQVLKSKKKGGAGSGGGIGLYTYEELRRILGSDSLDIIIKRDEHGVKLSVGKNTARPDDEK